MDVRFALPGLAQLDRLHCDAVLLPLFADERPLSGALGLLDWRLCGFISRLVVQGRLDGHRGETTLLPGRPRVPFDKVVLFGLGTQQDFSDTVLDETLDRMMSVIRCTKGRSFAAVLPGRNLERIDAERAMEAFVRRLYREEHDEVTLIDTGEGHKVMGAVVARERRRARAPAS